MPASSKIIKLIGDMLRERKRISVGTIVRANLINEALKKKKK